MRREMTEDKNLDAEVADKIGEYVVQKGARELLHSLRANATLSSNASALAGLDDMALLFDYLEAFQVLDRVSFDLSLARGLDYYTGVIYEVVTEGSAPPSASTSTSTSSRHPPSQSKSKKPHATATDPDEDRSSDPAIGVGSVAAGGRYDSLVGMFSGRTQIPCVGISFGVDRIFSLTKSRSSPTTLALRPSEIDVYVMAFGGKGFTGLLAERMSIARTLWDAGIKAEFAYKAKPKLPAQFKAAEANGVPFAVILGEDEQKAGQVRIKQLGLREGHPEKDGVLIDVKALVQQVRSRLERLSAGEEEQIEGETAAGAVVEAVQDLSLQAKAKTGTEAASTPST